MMRLLLIFCFCFLSFVQYSYASYFVVCEVTAVLKNTESQDTYDARIEEASVIDGHHDKGEPCLDKIHGNKRVIKVKGAPPINKTIRLKYSYYNYDRADGAGQDERWEYWPNRIRDFLPW